MDNMLDVDTTTGTTWRMSKVDVVRRQLDIFYEGRDQFAEAVGMTPFNPWLLVCEHQFGHGNNWTKRAVVRGGGRSWRRCCEGTDLRSRSRVIDHEGFWKMRGQQRLTAMMSWPYADRDAVERFVTSTFDPSSFTWAIGTAESNGIWLATDLAGFIVVHHEYIGRERAEQICADFAAGEHGLREASERADKWDLVFTQKREPS